jgi:hypothetical protein
MATQYTNLLGFALPTTGELTNTWGTVVNNSITELVEDAIAATATASVTSSDWTLSTTGAGATNEARCAIIIPTGSPGTSRNVIAPSLSKAYVVINQSDSAIVFKGAGPPQTTGITIAAGSKVLIAWNGTDFVQVGASIGGSTTQVQYNNNGDFAGSAAFTFSSGTGTVSATAFSGSGASLTNLNANNVASGTLAIARGGTGSASTAYCNLASNVTGTLPIANGGTGTTSTTYCNLTSNVTGTLPIANGGTNITTYTTGDVLYASASNTLAKLPIGTTGQVLSVSAGGIPSWTSTSPGGVTSVTASSPLFSSGGTTPNISFTGTLAIANGGTGSTSTTYCNLTSNVTGTLPISNGGTGATSDSSARSNLGLGSIATQNSNNVSITGGSISGVTLSGYAQLSAGNTFTSDQRISSGTTSRLLLGSSGTQGIEYNSSTGSVGVGLSTVNGLNIFSTYADFVLGDVRKPGGGTFNSSSDARLKENIVDYSKGLNAIKSLRPVNYNYNDVTPLGEQTKHKTFTGLIAQEVEQTALADMVATGNDGYKLLDVSELTFALVNAVKELSAQVDSLKAEVAALKGN